MKLSHKRCDLKKSFHYYCNFLSRCHETVHKFIKCVVPPVLRPQHQRFFFHKCYSLAVSQLMGSILLKPVYPWTHCMAATAGWRLHTLH